MLDRALAIVLTNVTISYSIYLQYSTHIHSVTLDARAHSVALDARAHSPLRYIDVIADADMGVAPFALGHRLLHR